MKILTKVLVGSRLHGLHTEKSDYDWRGVHISPLKSVLSPFQKIKNTSWIEGDEDNTSYELANFCKSAIHGNATIWEVFFSNKIESTSPVADEMRENWKKFVDTSKFIEASKGYSHNQWNKFYNFEDIGIKGQERTAKFALAFLRVMWQCEQFLLTGKFECSLEESDLYPLLKKIKPMSLEEIKPHVPDIIRKMQEMNDRVNEATIKTRNDGSWTIPDVKWIEGFIYRSYLRVDLEDQTEAWRERNLKGESKR